MPVRILELFHSDPMLFSGMSISLQAILVYFQMGLLHCREVVWLLPISNVVISQSSFQSSNLICSLNGNTNTILERSINLILEGPKAFFNLYPQPNIPPPFTTLFLANNRIVQGATLALFPFLYVSPMLYGYILPNTAQPFMSECPAQGGICILILSKAHAPHLLLVWQVTPAFRV